MTDLSQFAGRFHPLLVHFPIALLLLAALLRLIEVRLARVADLDAASYRWSRLVLALAALTSIASASTGWLLGSSGEFAGDAFLWHERLGIAVAVCATLSVGCAYLPGRIWRRAEPLLLAVAVVLLLPAGHLGSTLTHGEGFLTEHAPPMIKRLVGGISTDTSAGRLAARPSEHIVVYTDLVAPVFASQCVSCHGPAKSQGGLRLDSRQGLTKGGDNGAVITAGRAGASELIRRIYLPTSHADVMPPKGHRPLSPADAALVHWWVEAGASFDVTLADADVAPEVLPAIEALAGPMPRGGPTLPRGNVAQASTEAVDAVKAAGFSVSRIADGQPFLHVHSTNAASRISDESLRVLTRIAPQVLWLDVGGSRVSDRGLAEVARLPNLTRLHLQHTGVSDAGLASLAALQQLEYLNLYGTSVTDKGIVSLSPLRRLRALYVWETGVTPAGISTLRAALPRLAVETGLQGTP